MDNPATSPGLAGIMKGVASLAVILISGLAILLVLDLIPREAFSEYLVKSLLVIGIVGLGLIAIVSIARSGNRRSR